MHLNFLRRLFRRRRRFLDFPPELILEIAEYFPLLTHTNSLLRCNRRLHALLTPLLHRQSIHLRHILPATVTARGIRSSALHYAVSNNRPHLVNQLLSCGGASIINSLDQFCTPLASAALLGLEGMVYLLLAHGADVNLAGNDFCTPLHSVVFSERYDIARTLIEAGADREAGGGVGVEIGDATPLLLAVYADNAGMVRALGELGCYVNVCDLRTGVAFSAVQVADALGHGEVVDVLVGLGAVPAASALNEVAVAFMRLLRTYIRLYVSRRLRFEEDGKHY